MEHELYRSDELTHHGIKGQRWGIRRFQRKDGSLTPAGEKRRAKLESELDKLGGKGDAAGASGGGSRGGGSTARKKSASEMSDDELNKALNRARMEDEYSQRRPENVAEKPKFMKKMVDEAVVPAMVSSGKTFLQNSLNKLGEKILQDKIDPNSIEALTQTRDKLKLQQQIDRLKNKVDDDINWENMIKKQTWEKNNKAAKDELDAAKKAAKEAADKAKADEAARKANEAISNDYYNSSYRGMSSKYRTEQINRGRDWTQNALSRLPSGNSESSTKSINSGKNHITGLLDGSTTRPKSDQKLATYDENGNFIGYWSGIRGDSDVII